MNPITCYVRDTRLSRILGSTQYVKFKDGCMMIQYDWLACGTVLYMSLLLVVLKETGIIERDDLLLTKR